MSGSAWRRCLKVTLVAAGLAACSSEPAGPTPSATAVTCVVEVSFVDGGPNAQLTGSGFPPDQPATLTITGPPDPGQPEILDQSSFPALRSDIRGVVLFFLEPGRERIGSAQFELTAGGCTASTKVELLEAMFPPACPEGPPTLDAATSEAYASLIRADQPIAYWRFEDEPDSPVALAEVGPPAAIIGEAFLGQAGVAGSRAVGFRVDGRVAIKPIELAGDFTIEGWLFLCDDPIDERDGLFAAREGAPNVNFFAEGPRFWTGDEDLVFADDGFATHLRWYHIALLRAGGQVTLAVDGVSLGTAPFDDMLDIAWLGDSGGGETSGQLDEFAIYDHALSLEDLARRVAAAR